MSLLREIQDAAVDSDVELATLLRKCKVLGARLGNSEILRNAGILTSHGDIVTMIAIKNPDSGYLSLPSKSQDVAVTHTVSR